MVQPTDTEKAGCYLNSNQQFISFVIIFPLQLAGLCWLTGVPARAYIAGLKDAIHDRLLSSTSPINKTDNFPTARFVRTIVLLTAGITCPGLLWYVAVSLTP